MNPRILIVDDSLTVRMDLKEAMEQAGCATTLCADLATARQALQEGAFDLVILDVLLPDGDGIDLLKEIKSAPAPLKIPVLLLSTEAEVRDRIRGLATGADDYIGKPYDRAFLIERTRELVRPVAAPRTAPLVLIIEDSPTFREMMRSALASRGYEVQTAETGEEGLRLAAQFRPDAILVDGLLPGIDGLTVVRRLRSDAALQRIPTLLLTASEGMEDEVRSLEAGADSHVRKSEDVEVILARLGNLVRTAGEPAVLAGEQPLFGPKRILAVDDSPTFLQAVTESLRHEQYEVIQARSGEEALQLLPFQRVDCILLDLVMPGLSGEETCRRVKATPDWRDIPVMILTAHKDQDVLLSCLRAGADDYIPKTSDFDVLKSRLRAQLRRRQYEGENRIIREVAANLRKNQEILRARNEEIKEISRQLWQATRLATMGELAASIAHELNNPLATVSLRLESLLEEIPAGSAAHRDVRVIEQEVERMAALVANLLQFSRPGASQISTIDVPAEIDGTLELIQHHFRKHAIEVVREFAADVPCIHADRSKLRQLFLNLMVNASDAMTQGGTLTIRVTVEHFAPGPQQVVLEFRDTGVGIAREHLAHAMEPFFTTKPEGKGTGLGLAICRRIVHEHQGTIDLFSDVGKGTTVRITLPVVNGANRQALEED